MPSELVKRIDLDKIYPPFLERVLDGLSQLKSESILYVAVSGYRSPTDQAKLYFQGRTVPGKIVTNARPGLSFHNHSAAIDFVRDLDILKPDLQPSWDPLRYLDLKRVMEKVGLQVGAPGLSDHGHVQIVDQPGLIHKLAATKDMKEAWALLDELKVLT